MELLQLRYFYDSSKNENFSKTAQKYMVPTTSVSASIKRLEKELGCALFDRTANRIILNDNGKKLQQSLYIVFRELDQTIDLLSKPSADTRTIRMLVRAMRSKVTDYIIDYKAKHPHLSFQTVFDFDETNFNDYEIIIDDKVDKYTGYESFEICSMFVRLKAAAGSPLCEKTLSLKQLSNQPFISMGEQSSMHRFLIQACESAGFIPNIVVQTNDVQCYKKCLRAGVGIGLGVDYPNEYIRAVRCLNVTDFNVRQTIYAFYKQQSAYGNVEHFLNYLRRRMD